MIKIYLAKLTRWIKINPLQAILLFALLHGVLYVFLIPIWWHHEEPGHFEYVWLIANRADVPQAGDYDNDLRRQIAESMFASGHENLFNVSPRSLNNDPIGIGGTAVGRNKVLYYWLASLPLRVLRGTSVLIQLYILRLFSVLFFLLSIWGTWLLIGELVNQRSPLRWMVPLFMAALPGYLDNMTSVHDDVLGALVSIFFLWLSVRIIKGDYSPSTLIGWLFSIVLCFYSRDTTVPLALLAVLVPLFALLKQKTVATLSISVLAAAIFLGPVFFRVQDASQWFAYPATNLPTRIETDNAPFGEYALTISTADKGTHLGQSFSPSTIKPLRKKTFTFGLWIWADKPTNLALPILEYRTPDGVKSTAAQTIKVTTTPQFYTSTFFIPYEAGHTWITLLPHFPDGKNQIYYDGMVLAEREFSSTPPEFDDEKLDKGSWDGERFSNQLLRNPSAEHAWLGFTKASDIFRIRVYLDPALFLQTTLDSEGFGWFNKIATSTLLQTFWGHGAGAEIPLLGHYSYKLLQLITLIAFGSFSGYAIKNRKKIISPEALFITIISLVVWLLAFYRGTYWIFDWVPIVPYARYAYPAFVPVAIVLSSGILFSSQWLSARFSLDKKFPAFFFITFMITLAAYAAFSFGSPFHPWLENAGYLIFLLALANLIFLILQKLTKNTTQEN